MTATPLIVFAHADEAECFAQAGVPHLVTGVGKINAALSLTEVLLKAEPGSISRVVVLGTAGAISDAARLDTVYQVEGVVQHDFSLPSPALAPSGEQLLTDTATMATGDQFVQDDAQRERIAGFGAQLVDMEGYAYAAMCQRFGVDLQVFKIPSDFADSSTTDAEWDEIVFAKSRQLRAFWDERLTA